jgi:hypothetical protein
MRFCIDELRGMQSSGNLKGLILALSDPDSQIRAEAMSRLTTFNDDEVLNVAICYLQNDRNYEVRIQACSVLRNFVGNKRAVQALREALSQEHRLVRSRASFALAQMRAREALTDLVAMQAQGLEPDIADTVNASVEVLSEPDRSDLLIELVEDGNVEGIGDLFDCLLKPDHDEIESGLSRRGKKEMLAVFREWRTEGRLSDLNGDCDSYEKIRREYAQRLIRLGA